MKTQMTALAILLSSVVAANAGNGWNFFGITVPYHNDPCWEMYTDPLYRDQCNPNGKDNNLSPIVNQPVATPPKDDKPQVDDNGGDSDTGGGNSDTDGGGGVTDPGDNHNGGDTKDDTKDYNGGDTRDNSDANGGDSSDDSNGGNSDDRGDKKDKKRDRK